MALLLVTSTQTLVFHKRQLTLHNNSGTDVVAKVEAVIADMQDKGDIR